MTQLALPSAALRPASQGAELYIVCDDDYGEIGHVEPLRNGMDSPADDWIAAPSPSYRLPPRVCASLAAAEEAVIRAVARAGEADWTRIAAGAPASGEVTAEWRGVLA